MDFKKRIIIAVGVLISIFFICFIAFNIIGLNNNNVVEKGFFKKSKVIKFNSAKDYEYINFELTFFKDEIKKNKIYYTIFNSNNDLIHKGVISNNKNNTGELNSKGKKGIWQIKLVSEDKKVNLQYKCHIKTGNFK